MSIKDQINQKHNNADDTSWVRLGTVLSSYWDHIESISNEHP